MYDYLFSFSHFDRKQLELLKRELFTLSKYDVFFLTRQNFSQYYDSTYINLKKILFGKYLVVRGRGFDNINSIINNLNLVIKCISNNEMNLNFFCSVFNNKYYFYDFFTLSSEYNSSKLLNISRKSTELYLINILRTKYLLFFFFYISILNFNYLMQLSINKTLLN
jgi:hypothetical protein